MKNNSVIKEKYSKEISILKDIFGNSIEKAGGKGHRFYHQLRVAHYCEKLANKVELPNDKLDNLILAALFHDIGKAPRIGEDGALDGSHKADEKHGDHTDKNHVFYLLKQYLGHLHDEKSLNLVSDIISSKEMEEYKILSDADNLDEVGLINIWKMFTYGGAFNVDIQETIDYYFNEDRPRLLEKSSTRLYYEFSKELAKKRIQRVDDVLNALISETLSEDIA
ncbi:MAG: HD domain-containing protein [Candidatus Omnitrophica bacterium]|nr:HD domain-containing protein [Candidatus Omnitrophota bacterium]